MKNLLGIKNINCHSEQEILRVKTLRMTKSEESHNVIPVIAKAGFTLAEVLITLGIIGVVAAMTIPNLIANTRSAQYRSAFKKTVSTLSQAARMSQAQYGFDYAGINSVCKDGSSDHPDEVMSVCAILNGVLTGATYYKNVSDIKRNSNGQEVSYSVTGSSNFAGGNISTIVNSSQAYILSDGVIVMIPKYMGMDSCDLPVGTPLSSLSFNGAGTGILNNCLAIIDVNGVSLPNKEVSCSSGSNALKDNNCIVKNDAQHMTDVFILRLHNGTAEPATAAARYVLNTAK